MEKPLFVASPEDERIAREIRVTHIFSIRLYIVGRSVPLDPRSPEIGRGVFVLISNAFLGSRECRAWLDELLAADKLLHIILMEEIDRASIPELAEDMKDAFRLYHQDGTPASYENYRRNEYGRLKKAMDFVAGARMFVVYGGATPGDKPGPNRPELSFWTVPRGDGHYTPVIVERTRRRVVTRMSGPAGVAPPGPSEIRAPVALRLVPPGSASLPADSPPLMNAGEATRKSLLIAVAEDEWLARRLRSSHPATVRLCIVERNVELEAAGPETGASIFILLSNAFLREPACRAWLDKLPPLDKRRHIIFAEEIDEASVRAFADDPTAAYRLYHEDGRPASPVNCRVSEYRRLLEVMGREEDSMPLSQEEVEDEPLEDDEVTDSHPLGAPASARRGGPGNEAPPARRTKVIVVEHKRRWRPVKKPHA